MNDRTLLFKLLDEVEELKMDRNNAEQDVVAAKNKAQQAQEDLEDYESDLRDLDNTIEAKSEEAESLLQTLLQQEASPETQPVSKPYDWADRPLLER